MRLIITILSVCISLRSYSQEAHTVKEKHQREDIQIGENVPDITLKDFKNFAPKEAKLSFFKGKLLILDFWDKWCSACIAAFPEMEKLQNRFADTIQIILVARNSESELKRLFEKSPILRETKLPILIGDTILHNFFPHTAVPYHVWIDEQGRLVATTNGSSSTEENIRQFLTKRTINFPIRRDIIETSVFQLPLLDQLFKAGQMKQLEGYTILTKRHMGTQQGIFERLYDSSKLVGIKFINTPIADMLRFAYVTHGIQKITYKTKDISQFVPPDNASDYGNWAKENTFCFETKLSQKLSSDSEDSSIARLRRVLKEEIERYFLVNSYMEIRKEKCWVVHSNNNAIKLKTQHGESTYEKTINNKWIIRNEPYSMLLSTIEKEFTNKSQTVLIDEAAVQGNIDIDLPIQTADLEGLNKLLRNHGLQITEEIRSVNVLTIEDLTSK